MKKKKISKDKFLEEWGKSVVNEECCYCEHSRIVGEYGFESDSSKNLQKGDMECILGKNVSSLESCEEFSLPQWVSEKEIRKMIEKIKVKSIVKSKIEHSDLDEISLKARELKSKNRKFESKRESEMLKSLYKILDEIKND